MRLPSTIPLSSIILRSHTLLPGLRRYGMRVKSQGADERRLTSRREGLRAATVAYADEASASATRQRPTVCSAQALHGDFSR